MKNETRDAAMCMDKERMPEFVEILRNLSGEAVDEECENLCEDCRAKHPMKFVQLNPDHLVIPSAALHLAHMGNGRVTYYPLNKAVVVVPDEMDGGDIFKTIVSLTDLLNHFYKVLATDFGAYQAGCDKLFCTCCCDAVDADAYELYEELPEAEKEVFGNLLEMGACPIELLYERDCTICDY